MDENGEAQMLCQEAPMQDQVIVAVTSDHFPMSVSREDMHKSMEAMHPISLRDPQGNSIEVSRSQQLPVVTISGTSTQQMSEVTLAGPSAHELTSVTQAGLQYHHLQEVTLAGTTHHLQEVTLADLSTHHLQTVTLSGASTHHLQEVTLSDSPTHHLSEIGLAVQPSPHYPVVTVADQPTQQLPVVTIAGLSTQQLPHVSIADQPIQLLPRGTVSHHPVQHLPVVTMADVVAAQHLPQVSIADQLKQDPPVVSVACLSTQQLPQVTVADMGRERLPQVTIEDQTTQQLPVVTVAGLTTKQIPQVTVAGQQTQQLPVVTVADLSAQQLPQVTVAGQSTQHLPMVSVAGLSAQQLSEGTTSAPQTQQLLVLTLTGPPTQQLPDGSSDGPIESAITVPAVIDTVTVLTGTQSQASSDAANNIGANSGKLAQTLQGSNGASTTSENKGLPRPTFKILFKAEPQPPKEELDSNSNPSVLKEDINPKSELLPPKEDVTAATAPSAQIAKGKYKAPVRQVPPAALKVRTVKLPVFKPIIENPLPIPEPKKAPKRGRRAAATPRKQPPPTRRGTRSTPAAKSTSSQQPTSPKAAALKPKEPFVSKSGPGHLPNTGTIVLPKRDRPGIKIKPVRQQNKHPGSKPILVYNCNMELISQDSSKDAPPPGKFACNKCEKTFVTFFSLKRHKKNVHKDQEVGFSRKKQQKCPLCEGEAGATFKDLQVHLEEMHEVSITTETVSFRAKEDFLKWKANEEQVTKAHYVQRWSSTVAKNGRVCTYYYCHRSGFFRCTSTGKRHTKSSGSNKMNSMCPAHMKFRKFEDGRVEVEYVKTHVGHSCEVSRMRLTPEEKKSIAEKISNNIPLSAIIAEVRSSVGIDGNENLERIHLLSRRDVLNIAKEFNLKFAPDKPGDRTGSRGGRGKSTGKQNALRVRHMHSLKLDLHDVIVYGTGWLVKSESTDGILYNIERSGIECAQPCPMVCVECNCCIHQFRCSCVESTKKNVMCKHIHLVCRKLAAMVEDHQHQVNIVQQELIEATPMEEEQHVNLVVSMDPIEYHETQIGMHARVIGQVTQPLQHEHELPPPPPPHPSVKATLDEHFQRACEELNSELEDLGDVEEQQRAVQLLMETINRLRAAKRSKMGN